MSEFDFIDRYFTQRFSGLNRKNDRVQLGIGDDAAILSWRNSNQLVVSSDLLSSGKHFFTDARPYDVGFKSLAVNLSDMAAMGAQPLAFTLSVALSESPCLSWWDGFSQGLFTIASQFNCPLIGGDTTACEHSVGPIISITIFGELPNNTSGLLRSGVKPSDDLWVSGLPGKARLGLLFEACRRGLLNRFLPVSEHAVFTHFESILPETLRQECVLALHQPQPHVTLGIELRALAHSAIDLSDGLSGDLRHMLQQSQCGAVVEQHLIDALWCNWYFGCVDFLPWLRQIFLVGGDDYTLCFSADPKWRESLLALSSRLTIPLNRIGVAQQSRLFELSDSQRREPIQLHSFDHFLS